MTNELKEKIIDWVERITRYKGNDFILDEETDELLAIIDEGIEKVITESMPFIVSENMEERSGWNACIEQMIRNNKLN